MGAMQTAAPGQAKKDKPLLKTPIPGTDWIRVKTTQGNTFYSNKATKASLWTTPDNIRDAVRELEEAEAAEAAATERARTQATVDAEVARIKGELQEAVTKRKAGDLPASEVKAAKKPKVASAEADDDDDDSEEGEEEEWQKEAIAQLAAEAEAEKQRQEEERTRKEQEAKRAKDELEDKARKLGIPSRSDLSVDEAKAFFRVRPHAVSFNKPSLMLVVSRRPCSRRKTSIRCYHGTCPSLSSSRTPATHSYHQ
jgi:transcription elongation regulator 1